MIWSNRSDGTVTSGTRTREAADGGLLGRTGDAPVSAPSDGAAPILRLDQVTKTFDGTTRVVDEISFDLHQGETLTLLGPSGCGKTTTLRMIIGIEKCSSGSIEYEGRLVDAPKAWVPSHKRGMGIVFQSYAVWPHMTVAENVAYPLQIRRRPKAEITREVERVLALVGLDGYGSRAGTKLSGGQMQRVALARALIYEPSLLLLDEPFSNLDAKLRGQMRAEVKELQDRLGLTVLLVTHDQTEALSLSDRIALMRSGRIIQIASPDELYRHPIDRFARDFIGKTIRFPGIVAGASGDYVDATLQDGQQVRGRLSAAGGVPAPGAPCEIAIRPEQSSVRKATGAIGAGVRCTIGAALFAGDLYELRLATSWGATVNATGHPGTTWTAGETVDVEVPPDDAQVWILGEPQAGGTPTPETPALAAAGT